MSKSLHQRHQTQRGQKHPRTILDVIKENGVLKFIWKHIRMKPYGRKNHIGYGEEEYSKKFGEYCATQTNKKAERREAKKEINTELNNMED